MNLLKCIFSFIALIITVFASLPLRWILLELVKDELIYFV